MIGPAAPAPGDHAIELVSGDYLDLVNPDPCVITVEIIAHALAHTCRYAGQTRRFYSVAEHATLVAAKLRSEGRPLDVQLAGLHHDDAEAFVADVARPLKSLLQPAYDEITDRLDAVIGQALDVPLPAQWLGDAAVAQVKAADNWALAAEAYYLLPSRGRGWWSEGLFQPRTRRRRSRTVARGRPTDVPRDARGPPAPDRGRSVIGTMGRMNSSAFVTYRFVSVYSDGDRIVEGLIYTDDPEGEVKRLMAFRDDQDMAPIRIEYEMVPPLIYVLAGGGKIEYSAPSNITYIDGAGARHQVAEISEGRDDADAAMWRRGGEVPIALGPRNRDIDLTLKDGRRERVVAIEVVPG